MLTQRQRQVLDFVTSYISKHGLPPTLEEINEHIGQGSAAAALFHLRSLERLGYIQRTPNRQRGIAVVEGLALVQIPVRGTIAAGEPIEAIEENSETIAVPSDAVPGGAQYFALRVRGDSMVEDNVNGGDIVVVRQQSTALNGERVVAVINRDEATLKRYYRVDEGILLRPANRSLAPRLVREPDTLEIRGKVVCIVRMPRTA